MKRIKHSWRVPGYMQGTPEEQVTGYRVGPFGITRAFRRGWEVWHLHTTRKVSQLQRDTLTDALKASESALLLPIDWLETDARALARQLTALPNINETLRAL